MTCAGEKVLTCQVITCEAMGWSAYLGRVPGVEDLIASLSPSDASGPVGGATNDVFQEAQVLVGGAAGTGVEPSGETELASSGSLPVAVAKQ